MATPKKKTTKAPVAKSTGAKPATPTDKAKLQRIKTAQVNLEKRQKAVAAAVTKKVAAQTELKEAMKAL